MVFVVSTTLQRLPSPSATKTLAQQPYSNYQFQPNDGRRRLIPDFCCAAPGRLGLGFHRKFTLAGPLTGRPHLFDQRLVGVGAGAGPVAVGPVLSRRPPRRQCPIFHRLRITKEHQRHNLLVAQARRNAQIALVMSPYRKFQERLQAAQRRHLQQKAKRKFSLKNGSVESGAKRECAEGRIRGTSNSSVRRWRMEIGAMIVGQRQRGGDVHINK
uniref:Uncharacterized protein n=1 Tax=Globodera rostochiensis TaxID=31243 RepID=A0A914HK51_GLORO